MSVQEVKTTLASLSLQERDEVMAFLFHLRHSENPSYRASLERRALDPDPAHWLTPDAFERALDRRDPS